MNHRRWGFLVGVILFLGVLSGTCASPLAVPEGVGFQEALPGLLHLKRRALHRLIVKGAKKWQRRRKAPEFPGGKVTQDGLLRSMEKWLGGGYKAYPNGRYVSKDGLRQVRYGSHETRGDMSHAHFEVYNRPGGRVIENTIVRIVS